MHGPTDARRSEPAAVARRSQAVAKRPWLAGQDAWLLLELPLLAVVAMVVPEPRWAGLCVGLARLKTALGVSSAEGISAGLRLGGAAGSMRDTALRVMAARDEHHVQVLRELLAGWSAPIELAGAEHVAAALEAGRGTVLWVGHFSFNALAAKKALHRAGLAVSHLSRPEHGFSKSRFGIAVLNPLRGRTERRFLRERILIDRTNPAAAMRLAQHRLRANGLVSITAGAWEGALLATVPIAGGLLELSTGAPGLCHLTGAALLPVFAVREPGSLAITVTIDRPLAIDRSLLRRDAVGAAALDLARRLAPYVERYPLQWRDWERLRPPAAGRP